MHLACLKPYTRSFYIIAAMHLICDAVAYGFQEALVQPFGYEGFDDPDLEYPFQPAVMLCIFFRKFCGAFDFSARRYPSVVQHSATVICDMINYEARVFASRLYRRVRHHSVYYFSGKFILNGCCMSLRLYVSGILHFAHRVTRTRNLGA